ncbi:MAG: hypothetical protein QXE06_04585 [Candidatus Bathyarchaeia archaeon]
MRVKIGIGLIGLLTLGRSRWVECGGSEGQTYRGYCLHLSGQHSIAFTTAHTYRLAGILCTILFEGLADGEYSIDFYSVDNIGNTEPTNTVTVILDNTPPATTLTIGEPKYTSDKVYVTQIRPSPLKP